MFFKVFIHLFSSRPSPSPEDENTFLAFDVLLTVHLSIILAIN